MDAFQHFRSCSLQHLQNALMQQQQAEAEKRVYDHYFDYYLRILLQMNWTDSYNSASRIQTLAYTQLENAREHDANDANDANDAYDPISFLKLTDSDWAVLNKEESGKQTRKRRKHCAQPYRFECKKCGSSFASSDGVRKHWHIKHPDSALSRGVVDDFCVKVPV